MNLKMNSICRSSLGLIRSSVSSVLSVVKPSVPPSDSGSALILVLLITALLATIAVSFLSTSRVEQIAARNFSRQNAAAGLAELATQQAIANLNSAFNASGNMTGNYTAIVTSQPGRIQKFFFQNGTYSKNSTDLFFSSNSTNANGTVNLNNLDNSTTSAIAGLITGNPSESITVYLQEVQDPSGNQTLGRIAYYIDDEATKVNLNASSSDRPSLNVGNFRPLSLSGANITTSSGLSKLDNILAGSSSNTGNITNWGHFFRPEQAIGAGVISSNSLRSLANVTTVMPSFYTNSTTNATYTNSLYFKTPWGSDMVCINALSTNGSDGSGDLSVNFLHEALTGNKLTTSNTTGAGGLGFTALTSNSTYSISGQALNNVFGGNFATKYTSLGVKQIAANMLQMRDPRTNSVNGSFTYSGSLIGSLNVNATNQTPNEYLGYAPYPVITEVGISVLAGGLKVDGWGYMLNLYFCPTIEISNPYPNAFNGTTSRAEFDFGRFIIDEVSFDIVHGGGLTQRYTWSSSNASRTTIRSPLSHAWAAEQYNGPLNQASNDPFLLPTIPAFSKIQYAPNWGHWWSPGLPIVCAPSPGNVTTINNITNCTVTINTIKIKVGGQIRDWVSGVETGPINCEVTPMQAFPWNSSNWPFRVDPPANRIGNLTDTSTQRIDWIRKTTANATINLTSDDDRRNWTTTNSSGRGGGASGNASTGFPFGNWTESQSTWITTTSNTSSLQATETNQLLYNSSKANPSLSQNATIPSDPSLNDYPANAVYGNGTLDMRDTFLPAGNYTCPSDLGLVPTNKRWRRLRMQMQPKQEVSTLYGGLGNQTYIPDWAMLDFMAFNDTGYRPTGNMTTQSWSQVAGEGGSYNLGTGTYDVAYGVDGRYVYKYGVTGTITFNNANFGDPFHGRGKYGYVITTTSANLTSSNASISPQIRVNPNGKFRVATGPTPAPRTVGLKSLVKTLDTTAATGNLADPMSGNSTSVGDKIRFMGDTGAASEVVAGNIANMTWSSQSTWDSQRNNRRFPTDTYLLPSEVCEIAGVSDVVDQTDYNNTNSHFKWNEGRVSAILPGLTTCSSFFSIYAYAQVLDKAGNLESEALTKTMVEVEMPIYANFSATGTIIQPAYRVKKLYTQPIPLGQ